MAEKIAVFGPSVLHGSVVVHAAKNALLPILAAALLCDAPVTVQQLPRLTDTMAMLEILKWLGCQVNLGKDSVTIDASHSNCRPVGAELMGKLRASVLFLGAMLARFGHASLAQCGGCVIGKRPIDLHLRLLRELDAVIVEGNDDLTADLPEARPDALRQLELPFPSVGATENLLLATVRRAGRVQLKNGALEPEVVDLMDFLNACGGKITLTDGVYEIEGVPALHGCAYTPIPDRIEAGTYLAAGALCGGELTVRGLRQDHLQLPIAMLRQAGCQITSSENALTICSDGALRGFGQITTAPYPGFPTDLQAAFMSVACVSKGETVISEALFENRFGHVDALRRMGADICLIGETAVIHGVGQLHGTCVKATDLRAAGALVLAGLAAKGRTVVQDAQYLLRGYASLPEQLWQCGANTVWLRSVPDEAVFAK